MNLTSLLSGRDVCIITAVPMRTIVCPVSHSGDGQSQTSPTGTWGHLWRPGRSRVWRHCYGLWWRHGASSFLSTRQRPRRAGPRWSGKGQRSVCHTAKYAKLLNKKELWMFQPGHLVIVWPQCVMHVPMGISKKVGIWFEINCNSFMQQFL